MADVLGRLADSAHIQTIPLYTHITTLSGIPEGKTISLNENGAPVDFYIAKHDYEPILNGTGRTLLVRKEASDALAFNTSNRNNYAGSSMDAFLNSTYKARLPDDVLAKIGTTVFPYTPGNGNNVVSTLQRAVFLLSAREFAQPASFVNAEGTAL